MIEKPLISVIVPCYNQADFLDEALRSVANQTFHGWECIIVNDGSADDTAKIALEWVKSDTRFKYFYKQNGGLSSARNYGLDQAKGTYIQFLDSDDFLDPKKMELSLEQIHDSGNETLVAISDFRMFRITPADSIPPYCKLDESLFTFENILHYWDDFFSIPIHCGFFPALLFANYRFNENLRAKEDWVMWANIFRNGAKGSFIDKPLAFYRINPSGMTMSTTMEKDFMSAYDDLLTILDETEQRRFSRMLINRYYFKNHYFKSLVHKTTTSNSFRTMQKMKKILRRTGTFSIIRRILIGNKRQT